MTQINNHFLGNVRASLVHIKLFPNDNHRLVELINFVCYLEDHLATELTYRTRRLRMFVQMLKDEIQKFKTQVQSVSTLDQELVPIFVQHAGIVILIINTLVNYYDNN